MRRGAITLLRITTVVCTLLALAACGGQDASQPRHGGAPGPAVPWPPPPALKQVRDDIAHFTGAEFTATAGDSQVSGTDLLLQGGAQLTWAIYSLDGFSDTIQPVEFDVDFALAPETPGDATALWVGLADYSQLHWSWREATPPAYLDTPLVPLHFVSPSGLAAVAVVITGPGLATITEVRINRQGDTDLPAPQNLSGWGEIGAVHLEWDDVPGADGYNVYRSLSDTFADPVKLNTALAPASQYDDDTVGVDTTYYYKVAAFKLAEGPLSDMVEVYAPSENLGIPQNLRATPFVAQIQLDWDAVVGATGYEVFRDDSWRWDNPVLLTATPVPDPTYVDDAGVTGRIYYYRVRATHIGHSGLSAMVDVFMPQVDLPAPQNPRATDITQIEFRTAWDWAAENPTSFTAYVSPYPNFSLLVEDDSESKVQQGWGRSLLWDERTEQTTYYFRIVARNSSGYGRMTDDIAVTTKGFWHWENVEDIGPGAAPLVMLKDGGDLTAAYFNGKVVDVARRDAGVWTVDPGVLSTADDSGGFSSYLDLAAYNGNYVLASFAMRPGDLWAATGTLGAWTTGRVDGDGSDGLGHTVSGEYCKVAASADEFALLYRDAPLNAVLVRTLPTSGGSWSGGTMLASNNEPLYHSAVYEGTNLFVLTMDSINHQLLFGDRDGGWVFTDIADSSGENLGAFNQLLKVGTYWWTPAVNETTGDFYTITGDGATWDKTTVSTAGVFGNPIGAYCRLTQFGADMAMVFYDFSPTPPDPNIWWYGIYRSATQTWEIQPLQLSGASPGVSMDIAVIGVVPFILFCDLTDNHVKCLRGVPPPP